MQIYKHVGFTGAQQGWSPRQLPQVRICFLWLRSYCGAVWLHEGDCIGSDAQANETWREMLGKVWSHPPDKDDKRAFSPYNVASIPWPYLKRNKDIVFSSDLLVATPAQMGEELRSGTWATIRYARKVRKPIIIVQPNGNVVKENM